MDTTRLISLLINSSIIGAMIAHRSLGVFFVLLLEEGQIWGKRRVSGESSDRVRGRWVPLAQITFVVYANANENSHLSTWTTNKFPILDTLRAIIITITINNNKKKCDLYVVHVKNMYIPRDDILYDIYKDTSFE